MTDRPSFTDFELLDELKKICLIDDILAAVGPLDFKALFGELVRTPQVSFTYL